MGDRRCQFSGSPFFALQILGVYAQLGGEIQKGLFGSHGADDGHGEAQRFQFLNYGFCQHGFANACFPNHEQTGVGLQGGNDPAFFCGSIEGR